ncbi:MAG: acetyl-CoA C-acetyltransferase [Pirellulaceae bacterium]
MNNSSDQPTVAVVEAVRTPIGSFQGMFASLPAHRLGSIAIAEVLRRAEVLPDQVDELVMGQVYTGGCGANPARQASVAAGLPFHVPATTINMLCGSGLKAIACGYQAIQCGLARVVVAGGMESMSNAPYVVPGVRGGLKMGHRQLIDTMIHDALWDPFNDCHMGSTAEHLARKFAVSREDQDRYAMLSQDRYQTALADDRFDRQIVEVAVPGRKGEVTTHRHDEHPRGDLQYDAIAKMKPCFENDGTVTAANASGLNDGAATVLLMSREEVRQRGIQPLAWISGFSNVGLDPMEMGMGPAIAIKKLLEQRVLDLSDIDLLEVNEAFAAQTLAVGKSLAWDIERVNVNGGAIAVGHPLGASGSRVVVTLLHEMRRRECARGIAALCIGGGMGIAMLFEQG